MTKRCWTCREDRPLDDFPTRRSRRCDRCRQEALEASRCAYCGVALPLQADGYRPRRLCDSQACIAKKHEARDRALREKQQRIRRRRAKRCPVCLKRKPLTISNWSVRRRDPRTGAVLAWEGWCKPCKAASMRVRYSHDPQAREAALERARRQREEGRSRPSTERREREPVISPVDQERAGELPLEPLAAAVDRWIVEQHRRSVIGEAALADLLGTSDRTLRAWRNRERRTVNLDAADRALLAMDLFWWEVWDEETWPRAAAMWRGERTGVAA